MVSADNDQAPSFFSAPAFRARATSSNQTDAAMSSHQIKSSQPQPGQKPHLLSLPAELREAIYIYALVSPDPILLGYRGSNLHCHRTSLLRVNKQLRHETLSLFYSRNIFQASNSSTSKAILRTLSPPALEHITCWRATDASNATSTALFATTDFHRAQVILSTLHHEFFPAGLGATALRVPVMIDQEGEGVQWVSMGDMEGLEAKLIRGNWGVVRKRRDKVLP